MVLQINSKRILTKSFFVEASIYLIPKSDIDVIRKKLPISLLNIDTKIFNKSLVLYVTTYITVKLNL